MWWAFVFCSVLLSVPVDSNGIGMLEPIQRQRNVSAIACIVELCAKYFHSEKQINGALLVVHIQNVTPFHDTLMKTLMERDRYAINLMNQYAHCKTHYFNITEKAKYYLVAFSELDEVTAALRLWRELPTWNPMANFVAVLMDKYDESLLEAFVRNVLGAFFKVHVLDVKVISFRLGADVIQMHTWYPFEGTNCAEEVRNIHLVDECHYSDRRKGNQDVRSIEPLQKTIPRHLHGCPLRVVSSVYEPFVYNNSARRGIEVHLIRSLTRALGMKPIFIYINDTRDNREISNRTGVYSMLLRRYASTFASMYHKLMKTFRIPARLMH